ncbi:hypothetical protein IU494_30385 [Nocardia terpenica]|uniref:Uncharacterized protein n=1 Tax=Nocardia terpenica TaxID=455432 RepID=A0A164HHH3_9NOCA|nr:hypothetical protein [Nocardia terpenica]KZM68518.1 hypothetical protein AWN90_11665 [Nocardia terpenica]MBF6064957.1 hypothetical protein [Nocardia terpenica]MBF6115229.1 hypothetical protein [Nocardia terpenica]MBF6122551.1 hypothetical protein [Nocardia terpenica]NQE88527.1 hypothetical protein [Nocardia terpenica]
MIRPGDTPDADDSAISDDSAPGGLGGIIRKARRSRSLHEQRFTLAVVLLVVVAAAAGYLLWASVWAPGDHLESVRETGAVVFGPLVTLLGTSFAWYYATRKNDPD